MSEFDDYVELSEMLEMALSGGPERLVDDATLRGEEENGVKEIVEDEGDYVELIAEQNGEIISDTGKVEQRAAFIWF